MWEAIKSIFTSTDSIGILLCLILAFVVVSFVSKKGILKIDTKHVKLGGNQEREIIRRQIEYAHWFITSVETEINDRSERYGGYFTKYVLERVYDEIITWICFNHFSLDKKYINLKVDAVMTIIGALESDAYYSSPEFKQRVYQWVVEMIETLINIREVHSKCNI